MEYRASLIAGLRELADFLEQAPDVAPPEQPSMVGGVIPRTPEQLAQFAPDPTAVRVERLADSRFVSVCRRFGPMTLRATVWREDWERHELLVRIGEKPDVPVSCVSHRFGVPA